MDVLLFTCILSGAQEVYAYSLFTQIWGLSVCDRVVNRLPRGGVSPGKRARGGASTRAARSRVALCTGRSWQTWFSTARSGPSHTDEQSCNATPYQLVYHTTAG